MNTIKIYLAESGRVADLKKDFPLYQGQFQNKLLNVYVPTSILAPDFTVQDASGTTTADYVASTSVKIGMTYTARNGSINVSKNYYMRYLKTLTYQNVEYAMYERKLPKEFTFYAGQGSNAPVLIINVVNIEQPTESDGTAKVISITTSQTCQLDVMASTSLDNDEAEDATELENINSQINEINEILPTKQNINDDALTTTAKTVVGAINENTANISTNTTNIETNRRNIASNRNDIDFLQENMQLTQRYIGKMSGTELPTNEQLTQFVVDTVAREPQNGDVIIFTQVIEGATDRNFKYFYSAKDWQSYELPAIESASNGSLGSVQGTYGIGDTADTLVDISGGKILNIYVLDNDGATYRNIKEYLNTNDTSIDNIISGNTFVGNALRSVADGVGNNIVDTYLTQTLGATKAYVRDYAMPRTFNDVDFIATDGYQDEVPTTPDSGVQFTTTTTAVGDFQIFQIQKTINADFELSSKNGYSNNIYIACDKAITATFRLTTQYKKSEQDWADLNVELTSPILFSAGEIQKVAFGSPFAYLGESVIKLTDGDFIRQTLEVITTTSTELTWSVYSNSTYPSIFNLTSQSYTMSAIEQLVGTHIQLGMDGVIESNRVVFTVADADSYTEYKTNGREFFINAHLPVVVANIDALDKTLPVAITFGDTTYNLYNYQLGVATPLTLGNLLSVARYDTTTGFTFDFEATFFENSDIVGFGIIPSAITANQIKAITTDTDTIKATLDTTGTQITYDLTDSVKNTLANSLQTAETASGVTEIVTLDTNNAQANMELGTGLKTDGNTIAVDTDALPVVQYSKAQTLTDEQKAQFRSNIGAGESSFSGSYTDLQNKPKLDTDISTSLTANASETINGTINLHKISKTGLLADAITDSNHTSVTTAEKEQITTNQTNIATNTSDIGTLKTSVATNTTNIATNTSDIKTNASGIETNRQNITTNQNDINELKATTTTQGESITTNTSDISSLKTSKQNTLTFDTTPTSASTNPVTSGGIYTALSGKQATLTTAQTNAVNSGITSDLVTQISTNKTNITTNASDISDLQTSVSTNTNNISTNTSNIATNTSNISTNASNISSEATTRASAVSSLQTALDEETTARTNTDTSLQNQVTTNTNSISTNTSNITTLKSDLSSAEQDIADNMTSISTIEAKIPTQATSTNQLADKDFVNSSINSVTAYYITADSDGNAFESYSALSNATTFYSGGVKRTPTTNDYCIVRDDENHEDATTRYIYQNSQWEYQYTVNETAMTAAQLAAINSGVSSSSVAQINTNKTNIATNTSNISSIDSRVGTIENAYVSYATAQSLTDEQKTQARNNIGAGSSGFGGSYTELTSKPILNTNNSTALTANASETITGTISLHKVAKTGTLADLITDSTHTTLTEAEKTQIATNTSNISSLQTSVASKQDTLTFDTTPTSGSTNPVTSNGIYTYIQTQIGDINTLLTTLDTGTGV